MKPRQCKNIFYAHEKTDFDLKFILFVQFWLYLITFLNFLFSIMPFYCTYAAIAIFSSQYLLLAVFTVLYDFMFQMFIWLSLEVL